MKVEKIRKFFKTRRDIFFPCSHSTDFGWGSWKSNIDDVWIRQGPSILRVFLRYLSPKVISSSFLVVETVCQSLTFTQGARGEIQILLWRQRKRALTLYHSRPGLALYHYITGCSAASLMLFKFSWRLTRFGESSPKELHLGVSNQLFFIQLLSLFRYKEGRSPVHCTLQVEGSAGTSLTPWAALGMGRSSFALQEFPCLWHFPPEDFSYRC